MVRKVFSVARTLAFLTLIVGTASIAKLALTLHYLYLP
jgi:hypothetical protein